MISRRFLLVFVTFMTGHFAFPAAHAHRTPAVISHIEVQESGQLGITHRFHMHDVVSILALTPAVSQTDMDSPAARHAIASYVTERFQMRESNPGKPTIDIPLSMLGIETEGDYLFVYQETENTVSSELIQIRSGLLEELGGDWLNYVNFETTTGLQTLAFFDQPRWQETP